MVVNECINLFFLFKTNDNDQPSGFSFRWVG